MDAVVGTAGWGISSAADAFGAGESALARYATRFAGVEINSSFHRPHRPTTWTRWAESVPADFRFAVKLPKTITHERKLADCADLAQRFLDEASGLGPKLALLLVQLPPKLAFDAASPRISSPTSRGARARRSPASRATRAGSSPGADALLEAAQRRPGRRRSRGRAGGGAARRLARPGLLAPARLAAHLPLAL